MMMRLRFYMKKGLMILNGAMILALHMKRRLLKIMRSQSLLHIIQLRLKPFYMQPDPNRDEVVLCADLIAPEGYGEIIGGSERVHDFELLKKRLAEHHLDEEAYKWYLELRQYGSVPHSGFGLGLRKNRCLD